MGAGLPAGGAGTSGRQDCFMRSLLMAKLILVAVHLGSSFHFEPTWLDLAENV